MPLADTSLRFALDQSLRSPMPNIGSDTNVVIWKGEPCEIQASLFLGDPSVAANFVSDLSNVTTVNLAIRKYTFSGELIVNKSLPGSAGSIDNTTTFTTWQNGTQQQFSFELSNDDTNQVVPSDGTLHIWGVISITINTGVTVTVGIFEGELQPSGTVGTGVPPVPTQNYYTIAEIDALFSAFIGTVPQPPAGPAGGALAGTYPNPGLSSSALNQLAALSLASFGVGFLSLGSISAALVYLTIVQPQNAPSQPHLFLSAYNSSSGSFTQRRPDWGDLTNVPETVAGFGIQDALYSGVGANQGVLTTDVRLSDARSANAIKTLTSHAISTASDPTDGQVLGYNAGTGKWQPVDQVGGGGGGGSAGGSSAQLQYNNVGVLGGTVSLIYDGTYPVFCDPIVASKKFRFDVSHVSTSTTRVMNVPDLDATFVQPLSVIPGYFVRGLNNLGQLVTDQVFFNELVGSIDPTQLCAFVGDVTMVAGGNTTVLANIPSTTPLAGYLSVTNIVAPSAGASGLTRCYVDSTSKNWCAKDDAGNVNHGVRTQAATTSSWIRSISDTGVVTISQPNEADLAFTDIATNNVSITKHGFIPKLPNDSSLFFNGVGSFSAPTSSTNNTFVGTVDKSFSNTNAATSIVPNSGVGSMTLVPSSWAVGRSYRLIASGHLSHTGSGTMQWTVKLGAFNLLQSGPTTMSSLAGSTGWRFECVFTCRITGSGGSVQAQAFWLVANSVVLPIVSISPLSIDLTFNQLVDVTQTFSAASTGNYMTCTNFNLNQIA